MDYFNKPLTQDQIEYLNAINSVSSEKVDLFKEFSISLTYIIYGTYLGDDIIVNEELMVTHFDWCWSKNINDLAKENIHIQSKGEHYYYYLNHLINRFYLNPDKDGNSLKEMNSFWKDNLTIDKIKTKSDYDVFTELFKIMDKYFIKNH